MKETRKDTSSEEKDNVFDMDMEKFMEKVCDTVKNRDNISEPDYIISLDLNENIPYKLYKNNTKIYLDD